MNNTITVDGEEFVLPQDRRDRRSVLNHLTLCLRGKKTHMRFRDKYGDITTYNALELQSAEIKVGDRVLKIELDEEE